jgi:hypothetical protein
MKHLRKFNESYGDDCSFEDFKDIMLDLLDNFNFNYEFHDYSSVEDGQFYDCWVYLYGKDEYYLHDDIPSMNINFLDYDEDGTLPTSDVPEEITKDGLNDCIYLIDENINQLHKLKEDLNIIIKFQEDCKKIFNELILINERFLKFENCLRCEIGFNKGDLRITFEIADEN